MSRFLLSSFIAASALVVGVRLASAQDFETRRNAYIATALANPDADVICIQAHQGLPVDQGYLDAIVNALPVTSTVDFQIVKLIRILMLSNGQYDTQILQGLQPLPFWVNYGDTLRGYWSENHMIMWMSSNWLLHEHYSWTADATLRDRLVHYLNMKISHGFYETFSSTYAPYCLSGIINLADFAQDAEIKALSITASQRLLEELLLLTNDQGSFFPVAGRNYFGKYKNAFGQNHNHLIYLASGMGEVPADASHAGAFLATSTLPMDNVPLSWQADLDTLLHMGHTVEEGQVLNASLNNVDRVMAQWSSGAYFHPLVVEETAQLLIDSNMWNHVDFELLSPFSGFSPAQIIEISNNMSMMSMSSVISGKDVAIYKRGQVTLSSFEDFWKGKVGYQQIPCVANVGTAAIMPVSGEVLPDWEDRSSSNLNQHLPYVDQSHNVALIMYREEPKPEILGYEHPEVSLFWPDTLMDEVIEDGLWLIGRQGDGYVAARRGCLGEVNGIQTCLEPEGQTWVLVVGDAQMYGDFGTFTQLVHDAVVTEDWYTDPLTDELVYEANVTFDTISINYAWGRAIDHTGIRDGADRHGILSICPNPSTDGFQVILPESGGWRLTVTDLTGAVVPADAHLLNDKAVIKGLGAGCYLITASDGTRTLHGRAVVH
jgi:hypothetical protein